MGAALGRLPVRGPGARELGLPLPPPGVAPGVAGAARLPLMRAGRPLKRWRYVAAFGPELMVCAGDARIGPLRQRWWAVAEPGAALLERTSPGSAGMTLDALSTRDPDGGETSRAVVCSIRDGAVRVHVHIDSEADGAEPVEVVSPSAGGWVWTRKQAGLPARVDIELQGRSLHLELEAVIDDTAGYHDRRTEWRWSTGVGRAVSGERVAWNLVSGVHDAPSASERTVWVNGLPTEVGEARFADDLSRVETADGGKLDLSPWSAREHRLNALLVRSAYRQPFGTFSGDLPGGLRLAEGYGVMEHHDVRW